MIIYKITNRINGKVYIGQTIQTLKKRWQRHGWKSEVRKNMPITLAIVKYGKKNFDIEIIDKCGSQDELNRLELHYAIFYNTFAPNGYNLRAGNGRGSMSEEIKRKIGLANKGKKVSDKTRKRLSESHKGYKMLKSTKAKLSKINKGKQPPEHVRQAAIRFNEKKYKVTCPDGTTLDVTNMRKFCISHSLSPSKMCLVAQGKRNHHKEYIVKYDS